MSINSIKDTASSWTSLATQNVTAKNSAAGSSNDSTVEAFSQAVDQLKSGAPAVSASSSDSNSKNSDTSSGGGSGDSGSKDTTTVTRTNADGSTVIIVMQGDTVISERKVSAEGNSADKNPKVAAMNSKLDQFNATAQAPAGILFSADT
jgi:hypothetical protein